MSGSRWVTTASVGYEWHQIPYGYMVEVTDRYKELDLVNSDWRTTVLRRFVTLYRTWWPEPFQRRRTVRRQSGCLKLLFGSSVVSDLTTPWTAARLASVFSPSPRACSDSGPLSRLCLPTISPSFTPFSSSLQSLAASGSFLMSRLFVSAGPKYWSFNFSISPSVNIQGWFPLGWTGSISLQSK